MQRGETRTDGPIVIRREGWYADPAAATPAALAGVFAETFDKPQVFVDDDFFRLGGDSLLAESLMLAIERGFGAFLSPALVLDAPTPRALAVLVARALRDAGAHCLTAIRDAGVGPPLACVHGMNGHITYGQSLLTVFGIERPIYAIRARGLLAGERTPTAVESCAAEYVRELRRVRPRGPYVVLAPCGTSMIAYEMAQQLTRAGETVSGLVLADPGEQRVHPWMANRGLALALIRKRNDDKASRTRRTIEGAGAAERARAVEAALAAAVRAYRPLPYEGEVLLLYSKEWSEGLLNSQRGFPALVRKLTALEVSDTHSALSSGFREAPALAIREFLQRVAPL